MGWSSTTPAAVPVVSDRLAPEKYLDRPALQWQPSNPRLSMNRLRAWFRELAIWLYDKTAKDELDKLSYLEFHANEADLWFQRYREVSFACDDLDLQVQDLRRQAELRDALTLKKPRRKTSKAKKDA